MNCRVILLCLTTLALAACGREPPEATTSVAATSEPVAANALTYREGQHYERLNTPVEAADNEVVEVFSYACPACAQFQPEIDTWRRERGNAVSFRYVPAEFHPSWVPFARAYHTAQAMGTLARLHRPIFDALYRQRRQAGTIEEIADIVAAAGVDRARFIEISQSPEVDAAMERSRQYVRAAQVGSTPTLVVAGRYRVVRQQSGGSPLKIADWLLEHRP